MPIPNSSRVLSEFIPIQIADEVILARIDRTSRFSFIKRSTVSELNFSGGFSLILLPVSCGNKQDFIVFEQRDNLSDEIVLGNYAIEILKIN